MQMYLVGGAVRDRLLNLPVNERDWVVVGASVEDMLALGYKQVGKDFPVFIHPTSGEEYALARTERKTTKGHSGFIVHSSPEITLQEDLLRRDLTINAMAEDEQGILIDPYNGQQDLHNRRLRHVSPAFAEDPLRVLRVARFAAKLNHLQFEIDDDTMQLMQCISESGELQYLSPERVWQETKRALEGGNSEIYFFTLLQCGALEVLLPELAHALDEPLKQQQLKKLNDITGADKRYIALVGLASKQSQGFSIELVHAINRYFKVPRDLQERCALAIKYFPACAEAQTLSSKKIHALLNKLDTFRRTSRCKDILDAMRSIDTMLELNAAEAIEFLHRLAVQLVNIKPSAKELHNQDGNAIAKALEKLRCEAIEEFRSQYSTQT